MLDELWRAVAVDQRPDVVRATVRLGHAEVGATADGRPHTVGAHHQVRRQSLRPVGSLDLNAAVLVSGHGRRRGAQCHPRIVDNEVQQQSVEVTAKQRNAVVETVAEVRHVLADTHLTVGAANVHPVDPTSQLVHVLAQTESASTARPLGCSMMPAPSADGCCIRSNTVTAAPRRARYRAAVKPPIPAPTTVTESPSRRPDPLTPATATSVVS